MREWLLLGLPFLALSQEVVQLAEMSSEVVSGQALFPTRQDMLNPSFYSIPSHLQFMSYVSVAAADIAPLLANLQLNGIVVTSVCSYRHGWNRLYVVNADRELNGRHEVAFNLTMAQLQDVMRERTEARVEPSFICPSGNTFDVVWRHSDEFIPHFIVHAASLEEILVENDLKGQQGYYPAIIAAYPSNGKMNAVTIWRKGFGVRYRVDIRSSQRKRSTGNSDRNLRIRAISPIPDQRIILILRDEGFSWKGRLLPSHSWPNSTPFLALDKEIEAQIRSFEMPSVSIAIRLRRNSALAAAFGYADIRTAEEATPNHRYRLASISKCITAMLIMQLIYERRLGISDRVFGSDGILGPKFGPSSNPFVRAITIQHLLEHTSGAWGHDLKLEFEKRDMDQKQLLAWVLAEHPPTIWPGVQHSYSNVGYIFLGRVIEQISGMDYESYAKRVLFFPLNILDASIANNQRRPDEVSYYSHDNANPYLSWNATRLDSAAGWTLHADDVARVFAYLCENRASLFASMGVSGWSRWTYGRGLQLAPDGSLFHLGSMAGSEGIGFCRKDISITILVNVRGTRENDRTTWMESLARRIATHFHS